jgi:S1-C subfamily serine protease
MQIYRAAILAVLLPTVSVLVAQTPPSEYEKLCESFQAYSGAKIVFQASELPPGVYHDLMVPLSNTRRVAAAKIARDECRKFPPNFLRDVRFKAIGIFASCASRSGDGYRLYDKQLQGYRYYGIYNGRDAVAAAYYTDEQLPLTFHHEIFHHIDSLTDPSELEDRRWIEILAGRNLYAVPQIQPADLVELKRVSKGRVLTEAVSEYAAKNPAEDKAETARYLMSALADSLVQVCEQPKLAGSQRILHVLEKYRRALDGKGPNVDWFVDVALGRVLEVNPYVNKVDTAITDPRVRKVIRRVQRACVQLGNGSGINVSSDGRILTAAHVAGGLDERLMARFPDGRAYVAKCTAIDEHHDLAICSITATEPLPFASVAKTAPVKGTPVVCIGQPGTQTPRGEATGYQPFHVSTGQIRGFLGNPLGSQSLGRTKHDAWTYWGHSGSPLFNENGQIIAMHNSWDSTTAMRHAVTHEAIVKFIRENGFEMPDSQNIVREK